MIRLSPAVALTALVMTASPALAYLAQNDLQVKARGAGFEVLTSPGMGAARAWCAAGDYAITILGVRGTTPIWRVSEPPRPAGQGIVFSLTPEGAATKSGLVQLGPDDASLTAGAAQALCWGLED
jgi:hypothetical protein